MSKRTLTVAMHFEDGDKRPEFINDIFDRLMDYPEGEDGVCLFAASWSNLFEENENLESKIEDIKSQL